MPKSQARRTETPIDVETCEKVYSNEQLYLANAHHFLGYVIQKSPFDLIAFHHLIYDVKPDLIVETGTWHGGSALFYATIMDATHHGQVITIDNWPWRCRPKHERISYITASSLEPKTIAIVRSYAGQLPRVMVVLDSAHERAHVLKELELYAPLVTLGSYLVVEDTNVNGHPIRPEWGPGPWEAVHDWLPKHPEFEIDRNIQPVYTNNPEGWLRRAR